MNRPRNRRQAFLGRLGLAAAALGLIAAPAPVPVPNSPVAQQQGSDSGKQAVVQVQAPQAQIIERHYARLGAFQQHPVWLGREKRGRGRKAGNRSKWDYRR